MSELEEQNNIQNLKELKLNKNEENFENANNLIFSIYSILSMIKENYKQNLRKTLFSSSYIKLKEYVINKFDELKKVLVIFQILILRQKMILII